MINKLVCLRCGHTWIPRKEQVTICPNPACHTPYWNRPFPKKVGVDGERFVHEALPGSIWINKEKESQYPWDIEWEGIKIDVKTVSHITMIDNTFPFSVYSNGRNRFFVYVAILVDGTPRFWVISDETQYVKRKLHIKESIDAIKLPTAIKKEFNRISAEGK